MPVLSLNAYCSPSCPQNQLSSLEGVTGVALMKRDRQGRARRVTLTGWAAVAGICASFVVIAATAWWVGAHACVLVCMRACVVGGPRARGAGGRVPRLRACSCVCKRAREGEGGMGLPWARKPLRLLCAPHRALQIDGLSLSHINTHAPTQVWIPQYRNTQRWAHKHARARTGTGLDTASGWACLSATTRSSSRAGDP